MISITTVKTILRAAGRLDDSLLAPKYMLNIKHNNNMLPSPTNEGVFSALSRSHLRNATEARFPYHLMDSLSPLALSCFSSVVNGFSLPVL